jgi:hypothetical protein
METQIKIISAKKKAKLIRSYPRFLRSRKKALEEEFGKEKSERILSVASETYPEIVDLTPTFKSAMYDGLVGLASKLAALKKGMRSAGINTEEFVKFNIEQTRIAASKIPGFVRKLGGKIYLSSPMRRYLKKVAKTVNTNGWPTQLVDGSKHDDFSMSIETRNCQMVAFWESIGEGDIKPYCAFFDFSAAEVMGLGLKQISDYDSGLCKYCFYKKGKVEWPEPINNIIN